MTEEGWPAQPRNPQGVIGCVSDLVHSGAHSRVPHAPRAAIEGRLGPGRLVRWHPAARMTLRRIDRTHLRQRKALLFGAELEVRIQLSPPASRANSDELERRTLTRRSHLPVESGAHSGRLNADRPHLPVRCRTLKLNSRWRRKWRGRRGAPCCRRRRCRRYWRRLLSAGRHCQLKQGWYPPAVGGAAVRCREVLGTPIGLPPLKRKGPRRSTRPS